MPVKEPHVVVLGGGPAGCGAAYQLRRMGRAKVTLLERQEVFGGNAGSFQANGQYLDYGSHRLHAATDPAILEDIQRLLGGDLAHRDRHGRIRLRGQWLHFPLKTQDLMLRLDRAFAAGAAFDMASRTLFKNHDEGETFESVLRANLGKTICEHFYFPYARKIWGREPEDLSGIQARKRVSAGSFTKLMKRLAKPPGAGKFYYPKKGYGQISEVYAGAGRDAGAEIMLGWSVTKIERPAGAGKKWILEIQRAGSGSGANPPETRTIEADHIWSTIPITQLVRMMSPEAPEDVFASSKRIDYRGMVLVYLELDVDQFTTTDAHYFPEAHVSMTRLSEPKNYWGHKEPGGRTTLCAELPCSRGDWMWTMSDEALTKLAVEDLERACLPLARPPVSSIVKRLPQAYPIYTLGYERYLEKLDSWVETLPNLLVYGRQGLFAHDNTHHALFMAYSAVDCLQGGEFDRSKWNDYRKTFATHVVED